VLVVLTLGTLFWWRARSQNGARSASDHRGRPWSETTTPTPLSPQHPRPTGPLPGYLLIADRGNDRVILVDGRKRVLWTYPKPGTKPALPFHFDDDAFFGPGWRTFVSNQEEQQTIQVISFPGGKVVWHYGHVNVRGSAPGYLSTPDDAYLRPDGTVTVADVRNCRVLFLSPSGRVERQLGTTGRCAHDPPRLLAGPNGDTPLPGGGTLVTEIGGSWIDAIGPDGKLLWTVRAPVVYPSDAQLLPNGRILVADYASPGRILILTRRGKVVWRYGPPSGAGALDHPSLAVMLPNGLIAVTDDYRHRVVLIDPASHRIVWQYGHTDQPGRGPGYLNLPDGMDFLPLEAAGANPALRAITQSR
jgi:outer membrane protein assembly factor BamB